MGLVALRTLVLAALLLSGAGVAGDPNAVTRARVPEEYREHVRTYFGGGQ